MNDETRMTSPDTTEDEIRARIAALNLVPEDTIAVIVLHRVGEGHAPLPDAAEMNAAPNASAAAEVLMNAERFAEVHDLASALDRMLDYLRQRLAYEALQDVREILQGALEGLGDDGEASHDVGDPAPRVADPS